MKEVTETAYKSILVITSQVAGVGDIIAAVPTFRALRESFPTACLTLIANPTTVRITDGNPYFDDILVYNRQSSLVDKLLFIKRVRGKQFDLALCLSECLASLLLCYLSGARVKVGFNWNGRGALLTKKVRYYKPEKRYLPELLLDLVRVMKLPEDRIRPDLEFWLSEENKRVIRELFRNKNIPQDSLKIVIHPGAGWNPRRWPADKFALVAKELIRKYNAVVFILGAQADKELVGEIICMAEEGHGHRVSRSLIDCAGLLNLKECAALLSFSRLFIGNDSGPMHLAAAVGTPLIALFGPGNADRCAPRTENSIVIRSPASCVPCRQLLNVQDRCVQGKPTCMDLITVETVIEAAQKMLALRKVTWMEQKSKYYI